MVELTGEPLAHALGLANALIIELRKELSMARQALGKERAMVDELRVECQKRSQLTAAEKVELYPRENNSGKDATIRRLKRQVDQLLVEKHQTPQAHG